LCQNLDLKGKSGRQKKEGRGGKEKEGSPDHLIHHCSVEPRGVKIKSGGGKENPVSKPPPNLGNVSVNKRGKNIGKKKRKKKKKKKKEGGERYGLQFSALRLWEKKVGEKKKKGGGKKKDQV